MADVGKFSFPRLNNHNYVSWKFRMEMLLIREELWYVIDEPKVEPVTPQWIKDDKRARATIGLCVEENQFSIVKTADSAKEFWEKLRAYHEKATVTSRVSLLKKLCNFNLAENGEMESHLMQIEELFDRLTTAGQTLDESLKIAMILRSLPESYNGLVTALESRADSDITMQLTKENTEEYRLDDGEDGSEDGVYFDTNDTEETEDSLVLSEDDHEQLDENGVESVRRSSRVNRGALPRKLNDYVVGVATHTVDEPTSFKEAMISENRASWKQAMDS
ncbi:uncharacterized protein LOC118503894 [Anopheles stephensi]|uniref:uncharacterized protein LOC118503894 n=1 Tax=Anopheles stephensi TaxID=30069 RepID=UPI001658BB32|nr:uncharacterized protein LOC118503894 [Anopheles stephensi]